MTTAISRLQKTFSAIFNWRSLTRRLTILILTFFLFGILLLAFYSSFTLHSDMERALGEQQFATVSTVAANVDAEFDVRLRSMEKVAAKITPAMLSNTASIQKFLEDRILFAEMFSDGIWVTRLDGTIIAEIPISKGRIGTNYRNNDWMIKIFKGKSLVGTPIIDKKLNAPLINIGAPIRDPKGKVIGVVAGAINLGKSNFIDKITDNRYGKTGGYFLIAPSHRLIVTATDKSRVMQKFPPPGVIPGIDRFLQGYEGFDVYINPLGVEVLASGKSIPTAGMIMGVILPTTEAFAPIRAMQQRILLATIFLILLVGALTWWMLKRQLSPVFNTIKTLGTLSDTGKHPQPLHIARQDEIGELIASFNNLLESLGQREEELRQSEEEFRTIFDSSSAAMAIIDRDTTILMVNKEYCKISRYEEKDVVGKSWTTQIPPEDLKRLEEYNSKRWTDPQSVPDHYEFTFYRTDGQIRHALISVAIMPTSQKIICSFADITERKQAEKALMVAEETYRNIFLNSQIGLFRTDLKTGLILDSNDAVARFIGYPDRALLMAKPFNMAERYVDAHVRDEMLSVLNAHGEIINYEARFRRNDGTIIWIRFSAKIVREKGWMEGVSEDITSRKEAEAENAALEAQNRQLQKSESLGRMAAAIAHNFNNQLGVVIGNLEMAIDDQPKDAPPASHLTAAMKAAWKSADMSALMLTYLGQTHEEVEPLDISHSCSKILPILKAAMPENVILETNFSSPCPVINTNLDYMQQILTNLITNAWEAVGKDNGTISLSVKTVSPIDIPTKNRFPIDWQPQVKVYACLEVIDTGSGIASKDIEQLFDPFSSTKFTGRGMGLAVVLGLVKTHKGVITVESKPGRGSTFRLFFPASEETPPQSQKTETNSDNIISSPSPKKFEEGGTVLVVEDEEMLRDMAAAMLESFGFALLKAKDGVEALEIFGKHQSEIKFVLTDLTMPRMNGWETLTELRKLQPDIPVILTSGYDLAYVMEGDHPELPQAFLAKPYNLKALRDVITQALESRKK